MVEITATYPAGSLNGTTAENLAAAADGENEEWTDLYPAFADVADSEGFTEVAKRSARSPRSRRTHEERYRKLLEQHREGQGLREGREGQAGSAASAASCTRGQGARQVARPATTRMAYQEVYAENY